MSAIFDERDRLAAEKYTETAEATLDQPPCVQRTERVSQQPVAELSDTMRDRETFDTGAFRDTTDYRYDLIPTLITLGLLHYHPKACKFAEGLFCYMDGKQTLLLDDLADLLGVGVFDLAHFYAQALHEEAIKYGERNWERGLPESNLLNNALYHLFKLVGEDNSGNHQTHLTWNVLTLTHQRAVKQHKGDTQS